MNSIGNSSGLAIVQFSNEKDVEEAMKRKGHNMGKITTVKGYVHQGANLPPLWSQKLKIAFHKFILIGLLEE